MVLRATTTVNPFFLPGIRHSPVFNGKLDSLSREANSVREGNALVRPGTGQSRLLLYRALQFRIRLNALR